MWMSSQKNLDFQSKLNVKNFAVDFYEKQIFTYDNVHKQKL